MDSKTREGLIQVASGRRDADLNIKNARILNVFTNEIIRGNAAVYSGYIAGVGDYTAAKETIDAGGRYLVPGFVNAHCHVESSMVLPVYYCAVELRRGVTTLITDPHEIANVAGVKGIKYILEATADAPVNYYVMLPSCVPATKYEHSGAELKACDLKSLLEEERVLGLGEMMDYPGVLNCEPEILNKLAVAGNRVVDGHAPEVKGYELSGYAAAGISTDHESISFEEARDKLRAGMAVLVREGGSCKNLDDIITGFVAENIKTEFAAFCTDDKHLTDIVCDGSINYCIKRAIQLGLDPIAAYCMGTINAARIYRLRDVGAIAPGYRADMILLDDFDNVVISRVFKDGREPSQSNYLKQPPKIKAVENSVNIPPLTLDSFALPAPTNEGYPVIGIAEGQIITRKSFVPPEKVKEALETGTLCKAAVVERHRALGYIGVGLLKGYGLRNGAIASTVAHDSHNLIVAGDNDKDMLLAAMEAQRIHGGFALVQNERIIASLPLPVYGLLSDRPPHEFIPDLENMLILLHEAGVAKNIDPLLTLSFLALPVIPEIRITDMGVFDVTRWRFI